MALLTILGCGTGLAVCLIIGQKMSYELSYDKFNKNYENIYRASIDHYYPANVYQNSTATSFYPMGPELVERFPEVENMVRILNEDMENVSILYKNERFSVREISVIDTTFFNIFDLDIKYGTTANLQYRDIFISESLSNKIFGMEDPAGKVVEIFTEQWKVKGVFKDTGSNSHIKFHLLMVDRERPYRESNWGGSSHYTYVLLNEKTDINEFEKKLRDFSAEFSKVSGKVKQEDYRWEIKLQPIASIHLNSQLQFEHEANGNRQDIYLMIVIIIMLMIISCFNYTNLLKLINAERMKEYYVKKVFGASAFGLLKQNLKESLLFITMAIIFAGLLIKMISAFEGDGFGIELYEGRNYIILISILFIFIISHLFFPAFQIAKSMASQFLNYNKLSGNFRSKKGSFLALPQFVISVILIAMALTVHKQLEFLNKIELGFSNDHVLTFTTQLPYSHAEAGLKRLENTLRGNSNIKTVSFSETIPGEKFERDGTIRLVDQPQDEPTFCYLQMVSSSYFETYQIELLAGRSFSPNRPGESLEVLVNESLAKMLHVSYEKLVGREVSIPFENEYRTFKVIGIVKDYYHQSMRNKIEPCAFLNIEKLPGIVSSISVRTANVVGEERKQIMHLLKESFESSFPTDVANISFAKDVYKTQFKKDYQFSNIINTITLISIFMTILGLIGLASNYIRRRTKEVAIRKVSGASITDIFLLFGMSFLKLIGITFAIAFPLSIYLVTRWLEYFAIRIDLGIWFVVWPIIITTGIAVLSITYYVTKAAILDPVKILKEN